MFVEISPPRARDWAVPFGAAAVLYVFHATARAESWQLLWHVLAWVAGAWGTVNLIIHMKDASWRIRRDERDMEYRFTENYKAEVLSRMNQDQLRAFERTGRPLISVIPTPNGPVERLDGEPVFLFTAWYILRRSTSRGVYPIHNFKQGTYHFDMLGLHEWDDYTQAKAFTAYLCLYKAAAWGIGNTSASWINGMTPEKVMENLGLRVDSYDVPELGEAE